MACSEPTKPSLSSQPNGIPIETFAAQQPQAPPVARPERASACLPSTGVKRGSERLHRLRRTRLMQGYHSCAHGKRSGQTLAAAYGMARPKTFGRTWVAHTRCGTGQEQAFAGQRETYHTRRMQRETQSQRTGWQPPAIRRHPPSSSSNRCAHRTSSLRLQRPPQRCPM